MFNAMTSLTGGGGINAGSSAKMGDTSTGAFNVGGMHFGTPQPNNQMLYLGLAVVAAVLFLKK